MNLTNLWDRAIKHSIFNRSVDRAPGAMRRAVRPFGQPRSAPPQPCPVRRAARACLALLAAAALLALAAPAQAQTEVWSATLTPGSFDTDSLGCTNAHASARCSSTDFLSEDSFNYDSTDYNITGLYLFPNGQFQFFVDANITTDTAALTLVVGSTSLVLADADDPSALRRRVWPNAGVSLTVGADIAVKLTTTTPNNAAMGAPTITGTAQVGETLTAVTTGITDADGLTSPGYTYQWIRVDGTEADIAGANSSTYTLDAADLGTAIKVKVSFTDDASNAETLTSAATATVAAANTPVSAVLVSNVGQAHADVFRLGTMDLAQSFRTGTNADGYTLTSIELRLTATTTSGTNTPAVKLFSGSANGTEEATLTGPAMLELGTDNYAFAPSSTVTLLMSTTYWVVAVGDVHWPFTASTSEDGTPAAGWSIGDALENRTASSIDVFTAVSGIVLQIRVNGTLGSTTTPNTAPGAPTGLTATANGQSRIDLAWAAPASIGGSAITGYRIEVSPDGSSWSDLVADTRSTATTYAHMGLIAATTRHYRVSAINAVGTSAASDSDEATTEATTLISNFVGTVTENVSLTGVTSIAGQGFTTGPNFMGYGLDSIRVHFRTVNPAPTDFTASIWTTENSLSLGTTGDNTGLPLVKLFDLINPTDITTPGDKIFTAPTGTRLDRDTTYAVVFEITGGQIALDIRAGRTEEGDALAWSIIDFHYLGFPSLLPTTPILWSVSGTEPTPLRIEIRGTGPDVPYDSPALTVKDVDVTSEPRSMAAGSSTPDTYGLGETIVITVIAGEPVMVAGDPVFRFLLTNPDEADNTIRQATYDATRSRGRAFAFVYTVQADDRGTDGIVIGDHTQSFILDDDDRIFTTSQNIDIDRTHSAFVSDHKLDGSLTPEVTEPPRPTRPTLASATDTTLTIEWTHPGDGGSPLLRNAVRYRTLHETAWTNVDVGTTPVTRAVITDLQAGTSYEVQVQVTNARGDSLWVDGIRLFKVRTNPAATGAPAITGTAKVGQQLTASTTGIADANGLPSSFSYQWVRVDADGTSNPVNIRGATTATYTLTTADVGKNIKVRVSFTDAGGNTEMRTSAAFSVLLPQGPTSPPPPPPGRQSPPSPPPPGDVVGYPENPEAHSFQSGIGVISGWVCDAEEIMIEFTSEAGEVSRFEAGYGTERLDTLEMCGDTDNGFGLLFNWNLLGDGTHSLVELVDGLEWSRTTVTVTTLGAEFLRDVTGTCTAADFPTGDETVTLAWQQNSQNFVIAEGAAPAGATNRAGTPGVGYLENPGPNSFQSGIGVLSGWACEGTEVIIELNGQPQPAAYGTERLDTLEMCGDTDNGFGLLFNWNLLGEGAHEVVAYVDGEELGRTTVRVTTLGEEFVRGAEGECVVEDFPMLGETVTLEWQQSSQNFVIIDNE